MKNKLVFASGLATGYVLGARAGRGSYEKLKAKAQELWENPQVQDKVSSATEVVKNKAPELQAQVTEAAKKAQGAVSGAMHGKSKESGNSENSKSANGSGNPAGPGSFSNKPGDEGGGTSEQYRI